MYLQGDNGNILYMTNRPLARGDMDYGMYTDDKCITEHATKTLPDNVHKYYYGYYGKGEFGGWLDRHCLARSRHGRTWY
jgi:hypothetical protein